jgi:uncharacterized protein (TIGR00369 family)
MPKITPEAFKRLVRETLPFAEDMGAELVELGEGTARLRLPYRSRFLREGGTIGGPLMMALADLTMYGVVLSAVGEAEGAVTSSFTMNFLRRPAPGALVAEGRMLRLGRRLAFGEVEVFSEGDPDIVAHAVATYALPGRAPAV